MNLLFLRISVRNRWKPHREWSNMCPRRISHRSKWNSATRYDSQKCCATFLLFHSLIAQKSHCSFSTTEQRMDFSVELWEWETRCHILQRISTDGSPEPNFGSLQFLIGSMVFVSRKALLSLYFWSPVIGFFLWKQFLRISTLMALWSYMSFFHK